MRRLFLIASCALSFAACDFDSATTVETVENRCSGEGSCAEGVCRDDICVDASNASVEVALEIVSDGSDSRSPIPASWTYAPEQFSGPSVRDWSLPATREVRGTVRWDGRRVPAKLRFMRRMSNGLGRLQAIPLEVDTTRVTTASNDQLAFDYSARLAVGATYDLAVLPTDDAVMSSRNETNPAIRTLPPLYLEVTVEADADGDPLRYDVEFPQALAFVCDSVESTGCTIQAQVLTFDGETDMPEGGLQVRAVDVDTGVVVSSVAETTDSGLFAIRLGPGATDYVIRVTPSVGGRSFPAVSVDPEVVFSEDNPGKVIRIPRLDPVQYTGVVRDEDGAPVAGATVRLFSPGVFDESQLGLFGSFSGSATTNDDGTFGVELLPGFYTLQVTPPEDGDTSWGVLSAEVTVVEELSESETFVVPSKVGLIGDVSTFEDEPAPGLDVLARARLGEAGDGTNRSQQVASDSDGVFVMQMDRGLYDLRITAPPESGYAWLVQPALVMDGDVVRSYRLVPPLPVEGRVLDADGSSVAGVQLRAYAFVGEGAERRLLQVAQTTTDEEGAYRLLIAPRFAD